MNARTWMSAAGIAITATVVQAQHGYQVPPGFTVELVASGLPSATRDIIVTSNSSVGTLDPVYIAEQGSSQLNDGSILVMDPGSGGTVTTFAPTAAQAGQPTHFLGDPYWLLMDDQQVMYSSSNKYIAPDGSWTNEGLISVVQANGHVSILGSPTPHPFLDPALCNAYANGGVGMAFAEIEGEQWIITGTSSGHEGDCISAMPIEYQPIIECPGGGPGYEGAQLVHRVSGTTSGSPGGYDGTPKAVALPPAGSAFGDFLYFGMRKVSGGGPETGVYYLDEFGNRWALADKTQHPNHFDFNFIGDMEFGPGAAFGQELFVVGKDPNGNNKIITLDPTGFATEFVTGGPIAFIAFDDTDALYFTDIPGRRLLRVVPSN